MKKVADLNFSATFFCIFELIFWHFIPFPMDRRSSFAVFLGKKAVADKKEQSASFASFSSSGLETYAGPWEFKHAAHLLRRAMFGPHREQIQQAVDMGMEATVQQLLADQPLPDPPVNISYPQDPYVPIGDSWVYAPCPPNPQIVGYRRSTLISWTLDQIYKEGMSAREKMALFWHNHFAVEMAVVNNATYMLFYYNLFRKYAFGNFRELTKEITVDPAMLRYLNGNQNTKEAPNENYARELLELFTIGKGDLIAPGDYSNYTEGDIAEIARVLSGWRDRGYRTSDPMVQVGSYYQDSQHDTGSKQLSYHFNNAVISNAGEDEYKILIDIIFQQPEVARFIARKLYRWYVYYEIDEGIESNIIEPLAQIILDNDFEIKPALEALFKSAHFYSRHVRGALIKNPVDFVFSIIKPLQMQWPEDPAERHFLFLVLGETTLNLMQMRLFYPPSVAGWPAYYQAPAFHRLWANSVTLPLRKQFSDWVAQNATSFSMLEWIANLSNPLNPNVLIQDIISILFARPLPKNQRNQLKEILLSGLEEESEWNDEYGAYLSNPSNEDLAISLENRLRSLLEAMLALPEFQVS